MKRAHILFAGAALAVMLGSAAQAADLLTPADPIYSSSLFNFEGLYVGGTAGVAVNGGFTGTIGGVVGANFDVTDGIVAGVEFQGDAYFNGGGFTAYDALALGRVGGFIADNTMLYGDLGGGAVNGAAAYAFGGGLETAMTDQMAIRGDIQGIGAWGAAPSVGKATVGLIFHMN